jgi:hypothetical protein
MLRIQKGTCLGYNKEHVQATQGDMLRIQRKKTLEKVTFLGCKREYA